jgi:hypothetical protein
LFILTANNVEAAFFGAKFEPPDGKIYHCAQAEVWPKSIDEYEVDWHGIEDYTRACGRRPKLIMHYISFDAKALQLLEPAIRAIASRRYAYFPQIGLDFHIYGKHRGTLDPIDITDKIAVGEYDSQIGRLARLFKEMDTPAFLRPGYEFGGTGQGRTASKTYWIVAWRRIHDIFRQEGADQVAFVWNTMDAADFMDYYPGDDYVDWWGISVFINNADQDPFINAFVKRAAVLRIPTQTGHLLRLKPATEYDPNRPPIMMNPATPE